MNNSCIVNINDSGLPILTWNINIGDPALKTLCLTHLTVCCMDIFLALVKTYCILLIC